MLEISKEEGKIFKQLMPGSVVCTVHKRHYYMTENNKAFNLLERIRNGEDVFSRSKREKRV